MVNALVMAGFGQPKLFSFLVAANSKEALFLSVMGKVISTGMKKPHKVALLIGLVVATGALTLLIRPVPQDPTFHEFADTRRWLGIPNFGNVVSNFFFLVVAIWGGWELLRSKTTVDVYLIYGMLFAGILLTGIGSAFYHWHPDNDRLIWDRIPMTIVFMSLLAATVAEWVDRKAGVWLMLPLVALGIFSVLWWHLTEQLGKGDLRLYGWVQFFPMLCLPLILLFFGRSGGYTGVRSLGWVVIWYVIAKVLEHFDGQIFSTVGFVSGHTLKHIAAAISTAYLVIMFREKYPSEIAAVAIL